MVERNAIPRLGYLALPVAVRVAPPFNGIVEFKIVAKTVATLRDGVNVTRDYETTEMARFKFTNHNEAKAPANSHGSALQATSRLDGNPLSRFGPKHRFGRPIARHLNRRANLIVETTAFPDAYNEHIGMSPPNASIQWQRPEFSIAYSLDQISPSDCNAPADGHPHVPNAHKRKQPNAFITATHHQ